MPALNNAFANSSMALPVSLRGGLLPNTSTPAQAAGLLSDALVSHRRVAAGMLRESLTCICGSRLPLQVRLGLKSRTRPVFEGRWSCSANCLSARVGQAIKREANRDASRRPHRHRIPLGLVLLSTGAITHEDLRHALAMQHGTNERIGEVLARECGLSERKIAEALATQWGCKFWSMAGIQDADMAAIAPRVILERTKMLPIRLCSDHRIAVAFTESLDAHATFALQRIHNVSIDTGIAPDSAWNKAQEVILSAEGVEVDEVECINTDELERTVSKTLQRLQPVETRWARVHDLFWMRSWLEPASLAGGPTHKEDVMDFIFRVQAPRIA
jgi:hypothetical protein